jgi:hypothetical protein
MIAEYFVRKNGRKILLVVSLALSAATWKLNMMAFGREELIKLIMTFGRNELIELNMAFGRNELIKLNDVGPFNLIVKYSIMEWEVKSDGEAVIKQQLFSFGFSASAAHQLIGFVGFGPIVSINGFVGSLASSANQLKSLIGSSTFSDCCIIGLIDSLASLTCWLSCFGGFMICGLTAAIIDVMANISWRIKHAATHGVGMEYSRATKIAHMVSTSIYYSTVACSCKEKYVVVDSLFW